MRAFEIRFVDEVQDLNQEQDQMVQKSEQLWAFPPLWILDLNPLDRILPLADLLIADNLILFKTNIAALFLD